MSETTYPTRNARAGADALTLLDSLPVLVVAIDVAGRIYFANAAAAETMAAAVGGLVGRRISDVFGADSLITQAGLRAASESVRLTHADIFLEGPGFALGRAELLSAPIDEPPGAAMTFLLRAGSRSDVALRAPPPLARTLAHEVRNPLAGIRAAAQLIGKDANAETRVLTDMICAETDRIRRLTNRLDALDDLAPSRLRPVNIHEALGRACNLVAASAPHVRIEERYDPSLPDVNGDLDQLIQVFLNIAKNAAEAVAGRADGRVTVSTRYRTGVRLRNSGGAPARALMEAAITDNGSGVDPSVAGRLFEPFATTKSDGAGLGLAVAAEIVARHGGTIDVESRPGRTTFRVLLPLAEESVR